MRKASSRERTGEQATSVYYQEPEQVNPSEVSMKVTNVLKHLGDQRFALPPYAEHFERWLKDVKGILAEFEAELAKAVDQQYRDSTQRALTEIQQGLNKRIEEEKSSVQSALNVQQQLTGSEIELSRLENEYNRQSREIRRRHERASRELQQEINELGKQRLGLIRRKTSLLDRIFKRSESRLEEKTSSLRSRKNALGETKVLLEKELKKSRADHETKRKHLLEVQNALRARLAEQRENTHDDALLIRRQTCEELQRAISEAVNRFLNQPS
jgi:chromosome segregation ATPase